MATDAHNAKVDRLLRMIREGKTMTLRQQLSPCRAAKYSGHSRAILLDCHAVYRRSHGRQRRGGRFCFDRSGFYFHVADDGVVQRGCNRVYRAGGTFGRRE